MNIEIINDLTYKNKKSNIVNELELEYQKMIKQNKNLQILIKSWTLYFF